MQRKAKLCMLCTWSACYMPTSYTATPTIQATVQLMSHDHAAVGRDVCNQVGTGPHSKLPYAAGALGAGSGSSSLGPPHAESWEHGGGATRARGSSRIDTHVQRSRGSKLVSRKVSVTVTVIVEIPAPPPRIMSCAITQSIDYRQIPKLLQVTRPPPKLQPSATQVHSARKQTYHTT